MFLERTHTKNPPSMSKDKHQLLSAILFETWKRADLNNILHFLGQRKPVCWLILITHTYMIFHNYGYPPTQPQVKKCLPYTHYYDCPGLVVKRT